MTNQALAADTATKHLVTIWYISIKTAPHEGWMAPQGWGPYYTEDEGKVALAKADKLWMSTRLKSSVEERMLTRREVADLKRQGAAVSSLGKPSK
jgi:hypothetical protein